MKERPKCPTCGIPQTIKYITTTDCVYSCEHYKEYVESSPCRYCGKKNSPVRQVPAPLPVSECYCDDCRDKCAADYWEFYNKVSGSQGK